MKSRSILLKIQIPEPCSQSWEEMTLVGRGRHCAACAKTVTDFTHMTDAQILEALRSSAGGCGRFRDDQLGRELIAPPADKRFSLLSFYKLAASLLLVFSAGKVRAQETTEIHAQTSTPRNVTKRDLITVSGVVKSGTGDLLFGAVVEVQNSNYNVRTGIEGEFELEVADSFFKDGMLKLNVRYLGFDSALVFVDKNLVTDHLIIRITENGPLSTTEYYTKYTLTGLINTSEEVEYEKSYPQPIIKGEILQVENTLPSPKSIKKWWQFWKPKYWYKK